MDEVEVELELDRDIMKKLEKLSESTGMSVDEVLEFMVRQYINRDHEIPECVMERRSVFGADSILYLGKKMGIEVYALIYKSNAPNESRYVI